MGYSVVVERHCLDENLDREDEVHLTLDPGLESKILGFAAAFVVRR
jgi:hypothetical protein